MKEKHVVDAIKDKYDFTYDVDDDSVMKGTDVYYDVELKTNICDPDPDCGYYLAVILQREEADAPYTVLARVPIDARSDENVRISGHLTIDTLVEYSLKQCPAYDSSMHFRLAYAVVKYSASGSSVLSCLRAGRSTSITAIREISSTPECIMITEGYVTATASVPIMAAYR